MHFIGVHVMETGVVWCLLPLGLTTSVRNGQVPLRTVCLSEFLFSLLKIGLAHSNLRYYRVNFAS